MGPASPGMALSSGLETETQRGETGLADRIKVHRRIDEQLHGEALLQAAHHQRSGVGVQIGSDTALSLPFLTHIDLVVYVALGILLSVTALLSLGSAALLLLEGMRDWSGTRAIFLIVDRLMFVLMLIEILHTVRGSVRSGALTPEPFLIIGLIASIRNVLVITLKS